jgi:hypothetical protein
MTNPASGPAEPENPPPIGVAPEHHDYSRPWLVSALVSAACFSVGFALLYGTGAWHNIRQWADAPFMVCLAILAPVLAGFHAYAICLLLSALRERFRAKS